MKESDMKNTLVVKAPYKIVLQEPTIVRTEKLYDNDVEYVRADAFIKKACDWFRRIDFDDSMPPFETTEEFIEGFKKAMEE